jgi:hypothetical protein
MAMTVPIVEGRASIGIMINEAMMMESAVML